MGASASDARHAIADATRQALGEDPRKVMEVAESSSGRGVCSRSPRLDDYFGNDGRDVYFFLVQALKKPVWMPRREELESSALSFTFLAKRQPIEALQRPWISIEIPPGQDEFDYTQRNFTDMFEKRIVTEDWWKDTLYGRTIFQVTDEDPIPRLEAWLEIPGKRVDNEVLKAFVQLNLDVIIKRSTKACLQADYVPAQVDAQAEPIGWPGKTTKVVLTQALDDFIDYDSLWDEWVEILKYQTCNSPPGLKYMEVEGEEESAATHWTTFTTKHVIDKKSLRGSTRRWRPYDELDEEEEVEPDQGEEEQIRRFAINKARGWIKIEEWDALITEAPKRTIMYFHRDPLRIEALAEEPGTRHMPQEVSDNYIQNVMDSMMSRQITKLQNPWKSRK